MSKPRFVALGGGSTLHPTYTELVETLLKRYPFTPAFVFGSGVDDYKGTIRSSSNISVLLEKCSKRAKEKEINVETVAVLNYHCGNFGMVTSSVLPACKATNEMAGNKCFGITRNRSLI